METVWRVERDNHQRRREQTANEGKSPGTWCADNGRFPTYPTYLSWRRPKNQESGLLNGQKNRDGKRMRNSDRIAVTGRFDLSGTPLWFLKQEKCDGPAVFGRPPLFPAHCQVSSQDNEGVEKKNFRRRCLASNNNGGRIALVAVVRHRWQVASRLDSGSPVVPVGKSPPI